MREERGTDEVLGGTAARRGVGRVVGVGRVLGVRRVVGVRAAVAGDVDGLVRGRVPVPVPVPVPVAVLVHEARATATPASTPVARSLLALAAQAIGTNATECPPRVERSSGGHDDGRDRRVEDQSGQ
jgi:hypothetical protein